MKKYFIFLLLLALIISCKKTDSTKVTVTTIKDSELDTERLFIIAGIPEEPNRWYDENGELKGLDIDIIVYIMEKLNIPYKIILESSSPRLEANWMSDTPPYDMVFTYSIKPERQEYLIYAKESHIDFSWNFFIRKEDEGKFKFENYEDLKGLKIGATQGIAYTKDFWKAHEDGILTLDIIPKNEVQIEKLLAKRIDLVPMNTQACLYESKNKNVLDKISYLKKPIKSNSYYNTFVKKSTYPNLEEVIKKYDEVLKNMKTDGTLAKILSNYGL